MKHMNYTSRMRCYIILIIFAAAMAVVMSMGQIASNDVQQLPVKHNIHQINKY